MEEPPIDDQMESETESGVKDSTMVSPPPVPPVEVDIELLRAVEGVDILNVPSFELPALLNYTFERDIYTDMQFPIRDREFVEVFARIVAEASSRKHSGGVSGSGLFDNVYRMLAETVRCVTYDYTIGYINGLCPNRWSRCRRRSDLFQCS